MDWMGSGSGPTTGTSSCLGEPELGSGSTSPRRTHSERLNGSRACFASPPASSLSRPHDKQRRRRTPLAHRVSDHSLEPDGWSSSQPVRVNGRSPRPTGSDGPTICFLVSMTINWRCPQGEEARQQGRGVNTPWVSGKTCKRGSSFWTAPNTARCSERDPLKALKRAAHAPHQPLTSTNNEGETR